MDIAVIESNLSRFEKSQIGEAMSLLKVLSANNSSAHMTSLHINLKALGFSLQDSANNIKMGVAQLVENQTGTVKYSKYLSVLCHILCPDLIRQMKLSGDGDEIAPSLASEIAKLHNSSQLGSYTNYYDR